VAETRLDDRLPSALTWTVDEAMERSSHALAEGGRVWLVDPVADPRALEAAEALGRVTAVVQLLDRHPRDCKGLAARYEVPHLRLPEHLPSTPFEVKRVTWVPGWREVALWWPEHEALVVPEAVGTASYFAVGGAPLGLHPFLRPRPPRGLAELAPRHVLPGHGPALHDDAAPALREALARGRRDIPRAALAGVKAFSPRRG
jgi:hypothetical protein